MVINLEHQVYDPNTDLVGQRRKAEEARLTQMETETDQDLKKAQ